MKHAIRYCILCLSILAQGLFFSACGDGDADYSSRQAQHFFGPTAMAVTPDPYDLRGVFLYVLNSQGDNMTVMDTKFRTIFRHHSPNRDRDDIIWLGDSPYDLAITEDGNWVYVTDAVDGIVRRVMVHPRFDVDETGVEVRAGKIVLPMGQSDQRPPYAYLTAPDTDELVRMIADPGNEEELDRIELPGTPTAMTALPFGNVLAVTTRDGDLVFVDGDPFQVRQEDTIHLGGRPGNLKADAEGEYLYVVNSDPPQVHVINLVERVETEDEITFDVPLANLGLTTNGKYLYLTSQIGEVYVLSTKFRRACGASIEQLFFSDQWPQSDPKMTDMEIYDCITRDEFWYVTYRAEEDAWIVNGSRSGFQAGRAHTNEYYVSDQGRIGFRIVGGDRHPSDGDKFYFETLGGIEAIKVGLVPDGVAVAPYWKKPQYDYVFIANTGTHNVSVLYTEEHVNVGAVN